MNILKNFYAWLKPLELILFFGSILMIVILLIKLYTVDFGLFLVGFTFSLGYIINTIQKYLDEYEDIKIFDLYVGYIYNIYYKEIEPILVKYGIVYDKLNFDNKLFDSDDLSKLISSLNRCLNNINELRKSKLKKDEIVLLNHIESRINCFFKYNKEFKIHEDSVVYKAEPVTVNRIDWLYGIYYKFSKGCGSASILKMHQKFNFNTKNY